MFLKNIGGARAPAVHLSCTGRPIAAAFHIPFGQHIAGVYRGQRALQFA